ncbi:MAG: DNA glycosylase [Ignavibacteriales bacterium]|nr:DNA glycosylase [Ignavibacteriales bacterium]
MLQRTKADQVENVYLNFIKDYPNIQSLSKADIKNVKLLIKSLGLPAKANLLVEAANFIVNNFQNKIPCEKNKIIKIPGVGDYTTGAIQAICFNNAEYVIDSNIARFINRYYNFQLIGEIRRKREIIEKAKEIFIINNQKKILFSILDFCNLFCKPKNPNCNFCLLKSYCKYLNK